MQNAECIMQNERRKPPIKSEEELNEIKEEVETLSKKLQELTEEELEQVCGSYVDGRGRRRGYPGKPRWLRQ